MTFTRKSETPRDFHTSLPCWNLPAVCAWFSRKTSRSSTWIQGRPRTRPEHLSLLKVSVGLAIFLKNDFWIFLVDKIDVNQSSFLIGNNCWIVISSFSNRWHYAWIRSNSLIGVVEFHWNPEFFSWFQSIIQLLNQHLLNITTSSGWSRRYFHLQRLTSWSTAEHHNSWVLDELGRLGVHILLQFCCPLLDFIGLFLLKH